MKFQIATATFALAAAAAGVQAAALPAAAAAAAAPAVEARSSSSSSSDEGMAAPLEARLFFSNTPHKTASSTDLSTNVNESSSSWTAAKSDNKEYGNGNYIAPIGCGRRSLAYRRAFRHERRMSYDSGNAIDQSLTAHAHNKIKSTIASSGNTIVGSPGAGNVVNCGPNYAKRDEQEHAEGLAILRSLGAMTERSVDSPLEILAARDIAYSAAQLGVRAYDDAGYDGLARRSNGDFALDCIGGAHCQEAMRREAEELLMEHARDLGFHF